MVARFDGSDAFADGFDDASAFMTEDNGEGSFGVFSTEGVGVYEGTILVSVLCTGSDGIVSHLYGRLQCSRSQCGPRGLLVVLLRCLR
jgi:hypothetical protein